MKKIKDELQNIICGYGQDGQRSQLKEILNFLRRDACSSAKPQEQKRLKSEEKSLLIDYASSKNLLFLGDTSQHLFISEGAEQKVYRFDGVSVIKLNGSIFYEYWLDYFNNLLTCIFRPKVGQDSDHSRPRFRSKVGQDLLRLFRSI